jgi:RNA polymerase sigma-70 factor (ECF subfamily)
MTFADSPVAERPMDRTEHDHVLIERAKTCSDAMAALYQKYQPTITGYVCRRVKDRHDAEDVVASVFLSMVRGLRRYRISEAPFVVWLYRIATNEINWRFRKQRIRKLFRLGFDQHDPQTHERDDAAEVRDALGELPLRYQNALSLHYLEGLSVEQVAGVLKVPAGTVKSRLARGRDLLRDEMRRRKEP